MNQHRYVQQCNMMCSRSALAGVVQCLCLLGKAVVLQGFLTAQSVGPARNAAVFQHASSLARTCEHVTRSGSRRRRSGAPLSVGAPKLSMSSSPPGGRESSGVCGAIAKGWVALLLCVAPVFGPDVLMQQGQGLPTSPRPPLASALSEEQVSATTVGCGGNTLPVFVCIRKALRRGARTETQCSVDCGTTTEFLMAVHTGIRKSPQSDSCSDGRLGTL